MKENKFVKFMNKLGVVEGEITHVDTLTGRYSITYTPSSVCESTPSGVNLVKGFDTVCATDLFDQIESNVMRAYLEHNHDTVECSVVSLAVAEKIVDLDKQIYARTASYTMLEELVCSEMLRDSIELDSVLEYFDQLDVSGVINAYMAGGWKLDNTPRTISEYIHCLGFDKDISLLELGVLEVIWDLGDAMLLSTTIATLEKDKYLGRKIHHIIDIEGSDTICKQLELRAKNMNTLPTADILINITQQRYESIVASLSKYIEALESTPTLPNSDKCVMYNIKSFIIRLKDLRFGIVNVFKD